MATIGVSLSGGGCRAAAFGLGTLLYLSRARLNHSVVHISSVSGGSITNAYSAYKTDFREDSYDIFKSNMRPLTRFLSKISCPELAAKTWFIALVILPLIVGFLLYILTTEDFENNPDMFMAFWFFMVPLFIFLTAPPFVLSILRDSFLQNLGQLFSEETPKGRLPLILLQGRRSKIRLKDLDSRIDHVLCATDLQEGGHFYLSPKFLLSARLGKSDPGQLCIDHAILASAAFPGAFQPLKLHTRDFSFENTSDNTKKIFLADGGIHDNLGTAFSHAVDVEEPLFDQIPKTDKLIVVDASSPYSIQVELPWTPWNWFFRQVKTLYYEVNLMHASNSRARATALDSKFRRDLAAGKRTGVVISLHESPSEIAEAATTASYWPNPEGKATTEARERATHALQRLKSDLAGDSNWNVTRDRNQQVKTTLDKIGTTAVARLIWHGYMLAMVKSYIFLGEGELEQPPSHSEFIRYVEG